MPYLAAAPTVQYKCLATIKRPRAVPAINRKHFSTLSRKPRYRISIQLPISVPAYNIRQSGIINAQHQSEMATREAVANEDMAANDGDDAAYLLGNIAA